jgi:hypothetical protein
VVVVAEGERPASDRGLQRSGRKYVLGLVEVFLTNGHGIAWNAEPIYMDLIGKLDVPDADNAARACTSPSSGDRTPPSWS